MENLSLIKKWLGAGSINVFGAPFAGKDTQCRVIAEKLEAATFGSGAIFREQSNNKKLQKAMSTGDLIPSDMFFEIILPYFQKSEFSGKPLILSSIGRWEGEESVIFDATKQSDHPTKAVVYLAISEEDIWKRHQEAKVLGDRQQRQDDKSDDILRNRINEFNIKTLPVIEFYRQKGLLIEIDGTQTRQQVTDQILEKLLERAKTESFD